ncbi:hypothetical protein JDV02_003922 [Purpureocillium takamizusanense]|uniref:Uncharacterized protein n=1 Tax=Purpureocillium takamizusanense TaxID=2060973 RepID=A0A9Q8QDD0_9HYPO|nr:uncharacterized protein JDV02_003922 [Purpureocillium takamizusanense]UNI17590.1 hypothetical protein JDV02_003922 [Purpureocillium takamizusanense]
MATLAKTIVATGVSSGLGFEAVKQLLEQAQPYRIVLGARDTAATAAAFDRLVFDRAANPLTVLPLDLADLRAVRAFAGRALESVDAIDCLLLNAGVSKGAEGPGPHGSRWCEAAVVNHFSQHYLVHLLREKLVASRARIVVVSSGAVRNVPDPSKLEQDLAAGSGAHFRAIYSESKFAQLLGAHWWRRQLEGRCRVVAVSPGLIPGTGLGRSTGLKPSMDMPDAKTVPEGAASILAALTRDDFPEDPERIFLTSWGEWWSKDVYGNSLDRALQDKWCPSREELEKEAGISS